MNTNEFKRLLKTFADHPDDLDLSRDEAVVQVQNQLIAFKATTRDGQIWVEESGVLSTAECWVAERLANMPMLARRILEYTDQPLHFVTPDGHYIDSIETNPTDVDVYVGDALTKLESLIDKGAGFSSFAVYLTAEAGEGKTTLINQLARRQAQRYLAKTTQRLVVPIMLGGRSFLRLDDMIIGSIANNYRFRGLYMDTFLELVKFGFIVPAFDGFEEMFVVGSTGEAVTSLGNLLANLNSMGQLLISARTAYFEIRDFETQARLFDGLRKGEASFARLKLQRWQKAQFITYWELCKLPSGEATFNDLAKKLGSETHPLLTRAVLVKRLADVAADSSRFDRLVQRISVASASYFAELVDSILEREVESKWLDRVEEGVHRPLLNIAQHHSLLSMIAVEMAVTVSGQLSLEEVHLVTELFCESEKLTPQVSRQVLARISDHPLLSKAEANSNALSFDHEEFRDFFLGEALGNFVAEGNMGDLQSVFRKGVVSEGVIDACLGVIKAKGVDWGTAIAFAQTALLTENAASYAKENGSKLIMRLVQQPGVVGVTIRAAYIYPEAFIGACINGAVFEKCYCHNAILRACQLMDCTFANCEFDEIEIGDDAVIKNTKLLDCTVHSVSFCSEDSAIFSPAGMQQILIRSGFTFVGPALTQDPNEGELVEDKQMALMSRALRAFQRSTGINESTLKLRLGKRAREFDDSILPELLEAGILCIDTYRGGGADRRFRLGVKMSELEKALRESQGSFESFIKRAKMPPSSS